MKLSGSLPAAAVLAPLLFMLAVPAACQAPDAFLTAMGGQPHLSAEQVAQVQGLWVAEAGFRASGTEVDAVLGKAIAAANGSDVDLAALSSAVVADAVAGGNSYRILFPLVDAASGTFVSYMIISTGAKSPAVTNQLGVAQGLPDGSIVLAGVNDEDTGVLQAVVRNGTLNFLWMEGVEAKDSAGRVTDNQAVAQFTFVKQSDSDMQTALREAYSLLNVSISVNDALQGGTSSAAGQGRTGGSLVAGALAAAAAALLL